MRAFLEKVKDILHSISDYVIMFAIVVVIGLIITWRLDILFPENISIDEPNTLENKDSNSKIIKKDEHENEESIIVKIDIPKEADSASIANLLLEEGLIGSVKEFEDRAKEAELEKNLRPGEYDIENNSTVEEIIKIITN